MNCIFKTILEEHMTLSPLQSAQKKKTLKEYWILILALTFFYAIICVPISVVTRTDAVVIDSTFPLIWETVMQVLNYLFYWFSFAYLMYFIFSFGIGECKDFFVAYGLTVCLRYGLNQFVTSYLYGFPSLDTFVANSLGEMVFFIVMDIIQMAIAVWITYLLSSLGVRLKQFMPFGKLFDFDNPLVKTSFKLAWIPATVMLLQRFVYDLGFVKEVSGTGSVFLGILGILIFYLADLLCVLLGHFVILLFLNRFFKRDEKARLLAEREGKEDILARNK